MNDTAKMPSDLRGILAALGDDGLAPGGGSAAALVALIAARLVRSVARVSAADWPQAKGAQAQAEAIERRVEPLIELDARRYEEALTALDERSSMLAEERDERLADALERAAEPPIQVAETAADIAGLAVFVVENGQPASRVDALSGAILAEAAVAAAAELVEVNLGALPDDPRIDWVQQLRRRAGEDRRRAHAALAD